MRQADERDEMMDAWLGKNWTRHELWDGRVGDLSDHGVETEGGNGWMNG